MTYKCKKCGFEAEGDYWNDTLRGQIMGDEAFMKIQDEHEGLIWKCPGCMKNVDVEEVK